jgi:hypothetical protein
MVMPALSRRRAALVLPALWLNALPRPAAAQSNDAVQAASDAVLARTEAVSNINQQIENYKQESGLAARRDLILVSDVADVRVSGSHPDWVRYRTLAYDRALMGAQTEYIKQQGQHIASETVASLFKAANQDPPPFDPGAAGAPGQLNDILRKVAGFVGGKLDEKLRELNIDPKESERAAPPQRHVQLREAFNKSTVSRSFGELVGMMPVKTFEGHDGAGNYRIGVVAVASPAMKELAQQVLRARGQFPADPARAGNPRDVLRDKDDLARQFGVRRLFDEEGSPVILSFGQWGIAPGSSGAAAEAMYRVALQQAKSLADAQIAEFLAASADFEGKTEVGELMEQAVNRMPDGYVGQEATVTQLLDGRNQVARRRSQAQVTGLRDLGTWTHRHPETKQLIIGAVRIWSATHERTVRAIRDQRAAPAATGPAPRADGPAGVQAGRSLMRAEDF